MRRRSVLGSLGLALPLVALWGVLGVCAGVPLAAAAVTLAPASLRRLRIDLGVEGGYLLWSATARVDGMPALALAGPWLGLSLSLGASLGRARGAK